MPFPRSPPQSSVLRLLTQRPSKHLLRLSPRHQGPSRYRRSTPDAAGNGNIAGAPDIDHARDAEFIGESEGKVDAEITSFRCSAKAAVFFFSSRCSAIVTSRPLRVIGRVALGKDIDQEAAENLTGTEGK